ncbi:S-methyl-5'-thioadenosine phosphorylase [Novosphingobium beihaiensis]|uniref:S-methyl-5'-thioadenosine phosphorylase n=1 Tax=Novosphingobium beihaiensis TaxID=2930389 RepID=A0ABT0BL78_9SPHN|nr:S-methyl-5'-thioadenosine phosphorylase [Novosphingobium beihaiensis]MCJ2185818.1 S-methyl-5'-thioadenosine phosphorylase [Novosphingobium beihaiensis]
MTQRPLAGVIGGSGLYDMEALEDAREVTMDTPFGPPSDAFVLGRIGDTPVAFLARHGRGHRLLPSEVNYRANIHAMKQLGVRYLISVSAVGSLAPDRAPLDLVLPDQFIDLTKRRETSFFGDGVVAHVSMAQPVCHAVREVLASAIAATPGAQERQLHRQGTYVCIEGPHFSSLAESRWYQAMGGHIIGMTNMPEAKLALEAQIAYASLAMITDYDCWHPHEENVSADLALRNLLSNAALAQQVVARAVAMLGSERPASHAFDALRTALVTPRERMPAHRLAALEPLLSDKEHAS